MRLEQKPMTKTPTTVPVGAVVGEFVELDGIDMYQIRNFDEMPPFLMSIVSDSDHWMYVSTRGGLAAGRVEPERSLFPYETDDRLYRTDGLTGPFTLIRVTREGHDPVIWEPFTDRDRTVSRLRTLYKSLIGDTVVFEEARDDIGLTFSYRWNSSDRFGFIRTSTLVNNRANDTVTVEVLDGLLNVMPANVPLSLQQSSSTLAEAYRRNEVDLATGMAIYSLESKISDGAEPEESLRANIAWPVGLPDPKVVLSKQQLTDFRDGLSLRNETLTKGTRSHYLLNATVSLEGGATKTWRIVADVHKSQRDVQTRRAEILADTDLDNSVVVDIAHGSDQLRRLIATADGEQCTADQMAAAHHFANTLFNCMRGGVFVNNGFVGVEDLTRFIKHRNRSVHRTHADWLATLDELVDRRELLALASNRSDRDLERLVHEYLPLTFSRRHGDPSRPWNMFAIKVRGEDGSQLLDYQGNWRDIFQNWEALCYSFPDYLESIVAKFVNASTVDGFNPYRVTRDGIDWEVPEPDNPWSNNFGYWGDHQIIYLLRLLEGLEDFYPDALPAMLNREVFSYADVPYRIRPYDAIVRDSKNTLDFDHEHAEEIADRTAFIGADGRLLVDRNGKVAHATLAEKLLVPALAKLGNLVVDGGIWMNTQRPEWNDANNALVGYGSSMVTLAYLRRYFAFCEDLFGSLADREFTVSAEIAKWMQQTHSALKTYEDRLEQPAISDRRRKRILDWLGSAFSDYRAAVYEHGFSGKANVSAATIVDLCRVGRAYADHTMAANLQESGLYHSYNLVQIEDGGREMRVDHLPDMLEGQVAALSSGVLDPEHVLTIVDALYDSPLYRADQNSFMLYPARELPGFLEKNSIPESSVAANPLLAALLGSDDTTLIEQGPFGVTRFAPAITTRAALIETLDLLSADPKWTELVAVNRSAVEELYEEVFNHKRFTGRSGSMYKYEGLGSIYWHMVSKLLLAVQEVFWRAREGAENDSTTEQLARAYYRVRSGLSSDKTPEQYGAFPMDPYSHTPGHMGAQQPGMTGQVKEEVLTRWGELGIRVQDGAVNFDPCLLRRREFLQEERAWSFYDVTGTRQTVQLPPGSLGFTFCQVPIVYKLGDGAAGVTVRRVDGAQTQIDGNTIDRETSDSVFRRLGTVAMIEVIVPESTLSTL
jgi:hypothetical protein